MKLNKAPRANDSSLRQVTTRNKGAKRPSREEECSLCRRTIGKPYYWEAFLSQVTRPG